MKSVRSILSALSLSIFLLFTAACTDGGGAGIVAEKDEPAFRRGQDFLRRAKQEEALAQFESVIEKRMRIGESAPESHLEVGVIYLNHFSDPIEAIHHFRKFLKLKPESSQADKVNELVQTARKEFAKKLPGQPYGENMDRMDVMDLFKQVREENLKLKRLVAVANEKIKALGGGAMVIAEEPAQRANDPDLYTPPTQIPTVELSSSSTPSVYEVQSGDSLYKISSKVYGSGAHWQKIYEANRNVLSSPNALKPGMELRIPSQSGR